MDRRFYTSKDYKEGYMDGWRQGQSDGESYHGTKTGWGFRLLRILLTAGVSALWLWWFLY